MSVPIDIRDLPSRLNEALVLAEGGTEVLLTDGSKPRARIVPLEKAPVSGERIPNLHKGATKTSEDFDEPLPDDFWTGQP